MAWLLNDSAPATLGSQFEAVPAENTIALQDSALLLFSQFEAVPAETGQPVDFLLWGWSSSALPDRTADLSVTLDNDALAAAGALGITANASISGADSLGGSASVTLSADAAVTGSDTLGAAALVAVVANASITSDDSTLSADASHNGITADVSVQCADDVLSASGIVAIAANASGDASTTLTASASTAIAANAASTGSDTASADASAQVVANAAMAGSDALSASAVGLIVANFAQTSTDALASSASAVIVANASVQLDQDVLDAQAGQPRTMASVDVQYDNEVLSSSGAAHIGADFAGPGSSVLQATGAVLVIANGNIILSGDVLQAVLEHVQAPPPALPYDPIPATMAGVVMQEGANIGTGLTAVLGRDVARVAVPIAGKRLSPQTEADSIMAGLRARGLF